MAYTQAQIDAVNRAREAAGANTISAGQREENTLRARFPLVEQIFGGRGYQGAGGSVLSAAINYIYGTGFPTPGLDQADWFKAWQRQGVPQGTGRGQEVGNESADFLNRAGQGGTNIGTNYGITPQSMGFNQNNLNPYVGAAGYTGNSIVDFLNQAGLPSDFNNRSQLARQQGITNYIGSAVQNTQLLNTLRAQAQIPVGGQGGIPQNQIGIQPGVVDTSGLPSEWAVVLNNLSGYLQELERRGQIINPDIQIGPEQLAEFTRQAETEINPYYAGQLKLARESLLRDVGYSKDEILRQEQQAEQKYKQGVRTLGSNFAEQGFAQSGLRSEAESDFARDTQEILDASRRKLEFGVGNVTRGFAQQFGTSELPSFDITNTPQVGAGEQSFARPVGTRSLYSLDPSVYDGLVGSQQFEQRGAVRNRASQLENIFRSNAALRQQRSLVL